MASIYDHLPRPEPAVPIGIPASARRPRVLVVDDQPINAKLLERKLEREGMDAMVAEDGRRCLELARATPPDLILLDVMMPEMDGIEVCRVLQSQPETRDIPIIFVTARSGKEGKLEGLGAGAVDYIIKPIDLDETIARIRTHLRMRDFHRENMRLQRRLSDARRQALVGQLTLGLSHNLNNLLGIVVGYLDLMRSAPDNRALAERSMAGMDNGLRRIGEVISQVLMLGEHMKLPIFPVTVGDIVNEAVQSYRIDQDYQGELVVELGEMAGFRFRTNAEAVEAALTRLFQNAREACERVPDNKPRIIVRAGIVGAGEDARVLIRVHDNGTGLEPAVTDTLFEPFISVKSDVGAGLGLPLARHGIELLGGTLSLENGPGGGAIATISLPIPEDAVPPPVSL